MHYFKFNIGDWHLATRHLSLEEEAIYFRLITHYYDTEQPIPLETHSVIRRLCLGSHMEAVAIILGEFFDKTEKGFVHNRIEKELKEYRKGVKKNRVNGAKGGRPRKDVTCSETQEKPTGLVLGTQTEPKHNPNQEPLTTNHKPLTIDQKKGEKAKRFTPPSLDDVIDYCRSRGSTIDPEQFIDFYSAKDWMIGKNKMKDWKAACRTWEKREKDKTNGTYKTANEKAAERMRHTRDYASATDF